MPWTAQYKVSSLWAMAVKAAHVLIDGIRHATLARIVFLLIINKIDGN